MLALKNAGSVTATLLMTVTDTALVFTVYGIEWSILCVRICSLTLALSPHSLSKKS